MEEKTLNLYKCGLRALGAFSALSFLWIAFIATGISNGNTDIGSFASRLIVSDIAIALYSAVYGFSYLILKAKKLSSSAKRSLHIIVNYVSAMICVYALHSNVTDIKTSTWIILLFFATMAFFAIYGIAALIAYLVKRKK